jgi:hypothetical protein
VLCEVETVIEILSYNNCAHSSESICGVAILKRHSETVTKETFEGSTFESILSSEVSGVPTVRYLQGESYVKFIQAHGVT